MDDLSFRIRSWIWHRQGLDGSLVGKSARNVIQQAGWLRCVGGANPYLAIWARAGLSREQVDQELADQQIQELPCARGCTYVVAQDDFAIALSASQKDSTDTGMAEKYFNFTAKDCTRLEDAILLALREGPLDPKKLREKLGDQVTHFGEEGKKRGVTTSLSIGLSSLQAQGRIRRIPTDGRLDQERYLYAVWDPSPLAGGKPSLIEFARRYWSWAGVASLKHFKWFSGFALKEIQPLAEALRLKPVEGSKDLLILPELEKAFRDHQSSTGHQIQLVGSLDGVRHYHGVSDYVLDPVDAERPSQEPGKNFGALSDLSSHMIFDRGRLIGLWEFDPEAGKIVSQVWVKRTAQLDEAIESTAKMIREQLGDARSFSLDSPASRRPRIEKLKEPVPL